MASNPPSILYTARDYDTNLEALKEAIRIRVPSLFNSFFAGDLGTALLEVIAYDNSILSYMLDMQVQETFLDTLSLRASLLHFTRLTGYQVQRATAASVEVYVQASVAPTSVFGYRIPKGQQMKSRDGQSWEVVETTFIPQGRYTPAKAVLAYTDVRGRVVDNNGVGQDVSAEIKIAVGTSYAVLSDHAGLRLPSSINFGQKVSPGCILRLLNASNQTDPGFGPPPDVQHDEYAVIEVGKFPNDIYDSTVLYLDRTWDQTVDFVGQWVIENRSVLLTQGETKAESFSVQGNADQRKNFVIRPSFYPVISGSTPVGIVPSGVLASTVNGGLDSGVTLRVNGALWVETASLLFENSKALAYETDFDELDRLTIRFGDGIFGTLVPDQAVVDVVYRVGGGAVGNVTQGAFDTNFSTDDATVAVSSPFTVAYGGQDRQSITDAKKHIPQFVRSNDRAVTVEDYAYLASNFIDPLGRIKLAKGVLHRNQVPREQNIIWVYAWVQGANGQLAAPTLALKNRLLAYLNARKMVTDEVVIIDGTTTSIPVYLRYRFSKSSDPTVAAGKIQVAVNEVFTGLTPGSSVYLSKIYDAVQSVPEVEFVNILSPTDNWTAPSEFNLFTNSIQLGNVTHLLNAGRAGDTSVTVAIPGNFTPSGMLSIHEFGKHPSTAVVQSVEGNIVTFRPGYGLADDYTREADVVASDFLAYGWSYERSVNVFIRFTVGKGVNTAVARAAVARKVGNYFHKTIRPEEYLLRSKIEQLVLSVPNVINTTVGFNTSDSALLQIVPSLNEIITLGNLSVNNQILDPTCC